MNHRKSLLSLALFALAAANSPLAAQLAVFGKTVHTMGPAGDITDGVVVIVNGKITAVGKAADTTVPTGLKEIRAAVVTPGLIDAHSTVGLSGIYNTPHDSDQLERSTPMQPELRALDAYNPNEKLVDYVRSFGITTLHTGHAPGELISGQTIIVKTKPGTVDEVVLRSPAMVAATLSPLAEKGGGKSPGTRGKMMALLRQQLIKAQEYQKKRAGPEDKKPARDLTLESLVDVLDGKLPLLITANRSQDIASVLRLKQEFNIKIVLDSAAEAYLLIPEIKASNIPIILHPTMARAVGETENLSLTTAANLHEAGIPLALQAGYEDYVPKTRIILFEAALAAAHDLGQQPALATITIDAAKILGIQDRVGSLEVGKDADLATYDGDPFEYTTHCLTTIIEGKQVWEGKR